MKTFVRILIILGLITGGIIYLNRQRTVPKPAPAIVSPPVQTEPKPPEKIIVRQQELPPSVLETINRPTPVPVTNEPAISLKPDDSAHFTAPSASQAVDVSTPRPIEASWRNNYYSTNRFTLSARFGLNISGKFKGVGRSFGSGTPLSAGRHTPNGDAYNYDNGYVLTDNSGNYGGQSWYWGYDKASQVNAGANTIAFNHTVATGLPSENSGDNSPYVGAELTYDYELGVKEDWHHLRYGLEGAVNFLPIEFNSGGRYNATLSRQTDTYNYMPGTTPPTAPYQGSYGGPGFVINVPPVSSTTVVPGATFLAQQHFDANLWGFRLGPYAELPVSEKLDLFLTGGVAVGLLEGNASWKETLMLPGGAGSLTASGSGGDFSMLCGYYLGLNAAYQFTERWSVEAGVQYQNLGTYDHNFGGRMMQLDLSKSVFLTIGLGYRF